MATKVFLYVGALLVVLGLILMAVGTRTITYQHEVFTVNGMTLGAPATTPNYFVNFVGLAIFLFGLGGIIVHMEMIRLGGNRQ
ncbi:MAG: hypothetical protein MPF33_08905 [Candidatus Aramenus sp.]|jgi:hypothetical protein|nr:hypothetical protein [Candidatus Aramenus sp.]